MAIELATAYISLVPTTDGMRRAISKEFDGVARDAESSGDSAGRGFGNKFAVGLAAVGAGAGLALGAAVAKGTLDAINAEAEADLLAARLGLTNEAEIERVGKLQGEIFADAYGESLGDVGSAIEAINANVGDINTIPNTELEALAKTGLDVAKIFDEDVNRVIRASGQLVRTGLAEDAQEGLDQITAAAQQIPPEFRGELIDSVEEYGLSFAALGLTGEQALGALSNAVGAGARNTDLAADAFNEFSIRAIDGSTLSAEAFEALGLSAEEMTQTIANGGPAAAEATSEVIQALAGVGDAALQEQLGVALFGTQFEQLGIDVVAAMDPAAASLGDFEGAAARAGDTLNDNLSTRIESLKRSGFRALAQIAGATIIPILETIFDVGERLAPVFTAITDGIGMFFNAFRTGFTEDEGTPIEGLALTLRDNLLPIIDTIQEKFPELQRLFVEEFLPALQEFGGVLSEIFTELAPIIGPVLATLGGLVFDFLVFVLEFVTTVLTTTTEAWEKYGDDILGVVVPVFTFVAALIESTLTVVRGIIQTITALISGDWDGVWNGIKTIFEGVWDGIKTILSGALSAILALIGDELDDIVATVRDLPGRITSAARGMWDGFVQPFDDAMDSIRRLWNNTIGGFNYTLPDFLGGGSISVPRLHTGGLVEGMPGEEGLFILEAGERVLDADTTSALDAGLLAPTGTTGGINIEQVNTYDRPWLEEFSEYLALQPVAV